MQIKYIVTGGAGFIGSNLVRELNRRGEEDILIVDRLESGEKWKNLLGLRYEDYLDKSELLERSNHFGEDLKAVYHLGACSSTTEKDADYLVANNYRYTRELCLRTLEANARFVYASSAATYGDGQMGYSDRAEDTPKYRPLNMYGYSKQMFDLWALKNGLFDRIAGLKYFNVYGPGEAHKDDMRSVVHKAYGQIKETGRVKLFKSYRPEYGHGEQVRDFVYVDDAVAETLWLGDNPMISGLYNCGTGQARTWLDLAKATFAALELEPKIEFIDMPDHLREKYQYHTQADLEKLRRAGYENEFTSLEAGIRDYIQNHLNCSPRPL